jgi:iron complex outermembrane receptor protein
VPVIVALLIVFGTASRAAAQQPDPDAAVPDVAPDEQAPAEAAPPEAGDAAVPFPEEPVIEEEAVIDPDAGVPLEEEVVEEPAPATDMVVTGTRIKVKSAFAASAPVTVVDRKQLELAGVTNVSDVVQNLTIAQGSGFQGDGAGNRQGRIGVTGVDLRGLGFGATLVLVNGRRMPVSGGVAPGGGGATVDMGQIPMIAVERVEILKGGASAIYGSDAVAGVVNIITRKNWEGLRFEVEGEAADSFDYKSYNVAGAFGAIGEKARLLAAVDWDLNTELRTSDRAWTTQGQLWSPVGFPGTYLVNATTMPDPDCSRAPRSNVIEIQGENGPSLHCAFNDRDYHVLVPAIQRGSAFMSAEYDLTDHTTAFIEANFQRMHADSVLWPFMVLPPFSIEVPADHVDNPYGTTVYYNGRVSDQPSQLGITDHTLRVATGLKGDLASAADETMFEDWEWELVTTWGISNYSAKLADNIRSNVQEAINSCSDPSDLSNCFNPFYSSRLGTGTPNSEAVLARLQGESTTNTDSGLRTYNAGMAGSLFELPGGEVGVAFGGEIRHEWRHSDTDHDANIFDYGLRIGNTDYIAERDVMGGYVELRWPLFDGIEVQTAGRADYYTDIKKSAANPTLGVTLIPSEMAGRENTAPAFQRLTIRGHASTAFRAPEILDASTNSVTVPTQMQVGPGLPDFFPVRTNGNPNLNHEQAFAISAGVAWTVINELSLLGEFWHFQYEDRISRQDPTQVIAEWNDARAAQGNLCIDDFPGVVVSSSLAGCKVAEVGVSLENTPGTTLTNGFDFGTTISLTGETFGGGPKDWGTVSFGAEGTYTLTYDVPRNALLEDVIEQGIVECDGSSPDASCSVAGNRNSNNLAPPVPRLRMNFPVSWVHEGHAASFIAHYISALEDDSEAGHAGDFSGSVDAFFTMDANYGYTIKDWVGTALTFRVGVNNLADQDPPIVTTEQTGFEAMAHDPRGRLVYAKMISEF